MVSAIEKRFNRGLWPWVFLVTGAFVVSTNHVLGRYVGGEIPPIGLAFWIHNFVIKAEEEYLIKTFSDEYKRYMNAVSRWIFF